MLLEFLQKNNPSRAAGIDQEFGFRKQTGGFDFKKVEESTPTRLTGIVKERASDQFARFTIEVESAEPHRITQLDLRAIPTPAEFSMPRMSQDAALAALRAEVEKAAAADHFSGTVLVAKDGKPVFSAAHGLADHEKKIPNKLDTRFRIGSMNKMTIRIRTSHPRSPSTTSLLIPAAPAIFSARNSTLIVWNSALCRTT